MKLITEYPEKLVVNRKKIEGAFVFSLWKSPELYGEYELNSDAELLTPEARFYYSLGKQMYESNYQSFDDVTILTYISKFEEIEKEFNKKGGCQTVNDMKAVVAHENVESYYDEILKNNAVLQLFENGYFFKDEDEINKVQMMNYAQLEDYLEYKINNIFLKSTSSGLSIGNLTSGYEKWIKKWDEGHGVGLPVGYKMMNYNLAGIHTSNLILHLGGIGQGKQQSIDSMIATPDGWKRMGDMKVGDLVFGEDGKSHKVTGIFPQGIKPSYKVTFSDGTSTESGLEHLWHVQTRKQRELTNNTGNYYHKVITLEEIMKDYNKGKGWKYSIPTTKPVEYHTKNLEVDPYLLGLLLGDGGITTSTISFVNSEEDVLNDFKSLIEDIGNTHVTYDKKTHFKIGVSNKDNIDFGLVERLKNLQLLGLGSREKFIPKEYLFGDVSQRAKLLASLLNTDGCVVKNVSFEFNTYSKKLALDVRELSLSLGLSASYRESIRTDEYSTNKYDEEVEYIIHLMGNFDILKPYLSTKHMSKLKDRKRQYVKSIVNIEYVSEKESQCIMVDSDSHLYLTDDYIVTHNTTSALLMYVLPILEVGEQVLIIANEQNEEQFAQMLLGTILFNRIQNRKGSMNRQKLLFGKFTDDEKDDLKRASEYLKRFDGKLHYVHLTDYGTNNIKRVIKKYSKLGVRTVIVDTLKPTDESSDKAWAEFSETAKMLFTIAQKEDIAIIATAQLSSESAKRKYLDLSCIGKSRAIAETASTVLMFRPIRDSEKDKLFVYNYIKGTRSKQEIKLDKEKDYVVYFIAKNRYGGADIQIVYERNMSFNTMKEVGYCHIEYDGFSKA